MRALSLVLARTLVAAHLLLIASCGAEQNQTLPGAMSDPMGDAEPAPSPITPTQQPAIGGSGPAYGPGPITGSPTSGSETQVVDVGNPQETGPKAKLKFRIADAPIDGVDAFVLRVEKIYAVNSRRGEATLVKDFGGLPVSVDLLQYAQGNSFELADVGIPARQYDHIVVKMHDQNGAFTISGGMSRTVALNDLDLGQGLTFTNAILAEFQLDLNADQESDLTMHVPVWKKLKDSGGQLSLNPEQELYETGSVGGIRIVALPLGILSICATRTVDAPPPWLPIPIIGSLIPTMQNGDSDCLNASARSLAVGNIYLGHLSPAEYRLDLYLSSTLYISLPNLLAIAAGEELLLDLSWVPLP